MSFSFSSCQFCSVFCYIAEFVRNLSMCLSSSVLVSSVCFALVVNIVCWFLSLRVLFPTRSLYVVFSETFPVPFWMSRVEFVVLCDANAGRGKLYLRAYWNPLEFERCLLRTGVVCKRCALVPVIFECRRVLRTCCHVRKCDVFIDEANRIFVWSQFVSFEIEFKHFPGVVVF